MGFFTKGVKFLLIGVLVVVTGCTTLPLDYEGSGYNGATIAYLASEGSIQTGRLIGTSVVSKTQLATPVATGIALSPDASMLACITANDDLILREIESGEEVGRFPAGDLITKADGVVQQSLRGNTIRINTIDAVWHPTRVNTLGIYVSVDIFQNEASETVGAGFLLDTTNGEVLTLVEPLSRADVSAFDWAPDGEAVTFARLSGGIAVGRVGESSVEQISSEGQAPTWGDIGIAFERDGDIYLHRNGETVQMAGLHDTESSPSLNNVGTERFFSLIHNGRIFYTSLRVQDSAIATDFPFNSLYGFHKVNTESEITLVDYDIAQNP